MNEVEQLVIKNLLLDEEYVRKAMPFIKTEYFADTTGKKLFDIVSKYFTEYSAIPTKEALVIEVGQLKDISDDQHQEIVKAINNIDTEKSEFEWILDTTSNNFLPVVSAKYSDLIKGIALRTYSSSSNKFFITNCSTSFM